MANVQAFGRWSLCRTTTPLHGSLLVVSRDENPDMNIEYIP